MENKKVITFFEYIGIFLLAVISAFNYQLFIVKNDFAPAGLNGIATMLQYKTGASTGYTSLFFNVPLCAFAYFFIDKRFAVRSLFFCGTYSVIYLLLQQLDTTPLQYDAQGHDTIFPVILSGVIGGFVYGICLKQNGSTGGMDILSKYISKIKPEFNFFYISFIFNTIVAIASLFVYGEMSDTNQIVVDYKPACLCIVYCFISMFVGNYIAFAAKKAYKFTVITPHSDLIIQDIYETLKHGVTKIEAIGSYHNKEKTILICVVNRHQTIDFKNILRKYDDTFAYYETVNETYGNFRQINRPCTRIIQERSQRRTQKNNS